MIKLQVFPNPEVNCTLQCGACRNYIEDDGDFCEYCGARVVAEVIQSPPSPRVSASRPAVNRTHLIAAGLVVLILASIGFIVRRTINTEPVHEPAPARSQVATPEIQLRSIPSIPAGMVYVPGGTFQMGRNGGDEYEQPVHELKVSAFYIDEHEVTCAEYAKFIQETNHPAPPGWANGKPQSGSELLPVTGVSWVDADAYAHWAGKRLPTEEEWEFAARGNTGWIYPWGNEWKENCANAASTAAGKMVPVGSYPDGKSPFGVLDMVGNAWEWTASKLKPYPGGQLPSVPGEDLRVIRGNFWKANQNQATATYRRGYPAVNEDYTNTGFRCAKDAITNPGSTP